LVVILEIDQFAWVVEVLTVLGVVLPGFRIGGFANVTVRVS